MADFALPEEEVLGEHVFEGVLFSSNTETPVNVLTGEPPKRSQVKTEEAELFAERLTEKHNRPYVAKSVSVERQADNASKPYSGVVFHHFSIVGGMDMHKSLSEAWDSPQYNVEIDADYSTGTLRITVTKK